MAPPYSKVVVLDGHLRTSLAIVRDLARHQVPVSVICDSRAHSFFSRFPEARVSFANLAQVKPLEGLLRGPFRDHVVFPVLESTMIRVRELKLDQPVVAPELAELKAWTDKVHVLKTAESLGLPVPKTHVVDLTGPDGPERLEEAVRTVLDSGRRCYVKSASELGCAPGPGHRYFAVSSLSELPSRSRLASLASTWGRALVQEAVEGHGVAVGGFFVEGEPILLGGHRRLLEQSPTGGVSLSAASELDPECIRIGTELARALRFTGIGMVELKRDPRTGSRWLMELNPRPWGTLALYARAGLPIPYYAYCLASGRALPSAPAPFQRGKVMKFWFETAMTLLRARDRRQLRAVLGGLLPLGADGIFQIDDPMPAVMLPVEAMESAARRLRRWARRSAARDVTGSP